ncbi:WD40 repeat-like protein, partial [Rhizopogon vinicolor AM-OR11-026]
PDGQRIMTYSQDGSLRVWNLESGKQIGEDWQDGESQVNPIALSPDGKKVVCGSGDAVRLWDIDTGRVIATWTGHANNVSSVGWNRNGWRVVSGSYDETARVLWDIGTGKVITEWMRLGENWVEDAIHLPGGQRIMTCSDDGSLRVWNLESGKQIGEDWRDGESGVYAIALSPDGKKVVSGSGDAVRLWDLDTGKVITKWTGHQRGVTSVCWNRDGGRVVSGSYEMARVWDVESGETILAIETGFNGWTVIYSPDMTMIATGG